jgi:hypothetical protein
MRIMTAYKLWFGVMLLLTLVASFSETSAIQAEIRQLQPSAFRKLPKKIRYSLEARGCTIPQVYGERRPHNVIRGEFLKKGQKDWAVLCSKEEISTILIFEGTSTLKVTELASSPNEYFLQGVGGDGYGFSRKIETVGKRGILQYNANYKEFMGEEQDLPPIIHEGIDDIFVNKASVVRYYYEGHWVQLSGSD